MYAVKINGKAVKTGEQNKMIQYAFCMKNKSEVQLYKLPVEIVEIKNAKEIETVSLQNALTV